MGGPGACWERARPGRLHSQRGFALIDVIVATAIALLVFGFMAALFHMMVLTAASRHALMQARTQSAQLIERMRSEAASAWSIAVPSADVFGANNADGHELDFTAEDSDRHMYHWAYDYDRTSQTLTRYVVQNGGAPQPGAAVSGIATFSAREYPVNEITDPSSPIYDPLFAGAAATPVAYVLPDGSVAGNGFVEVSLIAAGTSIRELLSTAIAPTQFTVVVQYTPAP